MTDSQGSHHILPSRGPPALSNTSAPRQIVTEDCCHHRISSGRNIHTQVRQVVIRPDRDVFIEMEIAEINGVNSDLIINANVGTDREVGVHLVHQAIIVSVSAWADRKGWGAVYH